jgi:hypothetical protein
MNAGKRNMWQVSREVASKGILGVCAVSLTFGAMQLAFGRDLGGISQARPVSSEAGINRTAKADRAVGRAISAAQTQTISLGLDGLSETSVLIRIPVAQALRDGAAAPSFTQPGERKVACEPVVSVLTEVAKQLQPGRCVT